MAKANVISVEDRKSVIVEPERIIPAVTREEVTKTTKVTLELTLAEAEVIQTILGSHIIGNEKNSPRKYTDRIWEALKAAGINSDTGHYVLKPSGVHPDVLKFQPYPKKAKVKKPDLTLRVGARVEFLTDKGDSRVELYEGLRGTIIARDGLPEDGVDELFTVKLDTGEGNAVVFPERFKVIG